MNKQYYKKFFKILISNLLFLLITFNQNAISKAIPPGSGEGDVPANILILLDSSASMKRKIITGDGIENPSDVVELSDGNIIIGEGKLGFAKINTSDKTVDNTFSNNKRNFRGLYNDTCTVNGGGATVDSRVKTLNDLGLATNVKNISGDVIYGADSASNGGKVVGINTSGECVEVIEYADLGSFKPAAMEVRAIGGEDHLFVSGKGKRGKHSWVNRFYTKNLTTGDSSQCGGNITSSLGAVIKKGWDLTVDNSGNYIYYIWSGSVYGYPLSKSGNNYCPADTEWDRRYSRVSKYNAAGSDVVRKAAGIDIARDGTASDNIMYVVSHYQNKIQKVKLADAGDASECRSTGCTVESLAEAGRKKRANNTADPGALAAASVNVWRPGTLYISSDKIWITDTKGSVQEFDEDIFESSTNTSWQKEYGGAKTTRYEGAKQAILAVVSDSSLTSGANFGYGHWNSGESGGKKKSVRGGWECHKWRQCTYYDGWSGIHPEGTSTLCNSDSCLLVGVSPEGYTKIPAALERYGLAWGTDGNAFSQMALKYYKDEKVGIIDKNLTCQLSYVIVIGDGAWMHRSNTEGRIETLRKTHKVKTLVVAYGGGIKGNHMTNFDRMARIGSCNDPTGKAKACEETIVANTPGQLKTKLQSKIQQIIADRLSFTAPSITATIQEGGDLYQAQFNYEQHGEWQGTILRKAIKDGSCTENCVVHSKDEEGGEGNWDAAELLKKKKSYGRNIWTVLGGATETDVNTGETTAASSSYVGNWNNWTTDNESEIEALFELTDNTITDYHHTSSHLGNDADGKATVAGVADGTDDDLKGLINFVRGVDYFDYNGNRNITEDRPHLLGDIYHSQLVEVGPPSADTDFINMNQEAYWRAANNYQSFASSHDTRKRIIYAGANDGMLHAFDAVTGQEEWGFVPPFIAAKLPVIINREYDGKIGVNAGGTNPIFAVDGSPVVHDMYIRGLVQDGDSVSWETEKSWHTILMIPYGRGGAGFSVLDITHPLQEEGKGPLHMYSIFNDAINNKVLVADYNGDIEAYPYNRGAVHLRKSEEAIRAIKNQTDADNTDQDGLGCEDADGNTVDCDAADAITIDCEDTVAGCPSQDAIFACQTNDSAGVTSFRIDGTAACFKGNTFTFNLDVPADSNGNVSQRNLIITEEVDGTLKKRRFSSANMNTATGLLEVTFNSEKIFNASGSDLSTVANSSLTIQTSCEGRGTADGRYDYSQLGETWSTPRIFRIPSESGSTNIADDTYVAVMGGGMGNTFICSGSNMFIVNLESSGSALAGNPGALYGYVENDGPINIIDTIRTEGAYTKETTTVTGLNADGSDQTETTFEDIPAATVEGVQTPNGSNIANAIPASPVVITPDLAKNIPWRGAMVYINDLEGKITKINLTNQSDVALYAQTTLFSLRANKANGRYNYHSMDAAIGKDTNQFWLFGGTGNYERIGQARPWMDNILYGVKDPNYPLFKHLYSLEIPSESSDTFLQKAHQVAEEANDIYNVNNPAVCVDTTRDRDGSLCPNTKKQAWVIHLDKRDGKAAGESINRYRKVSATPTVYKGNVYYPIYQPPEGVNRCNLGRAYICSADDECGTNNSSELSSNKIPAGEDCYFVREGILSELVIFGDKLYANVAGPSDTEDTLVTILAGAGDITTYRRSWRENY